MKLAIVFIAQDDVLVLLKLIDFNQLTCTKMMPMASAVSTDSVMPLTINGMPHDS